VGIVKDRASGYAELIMAGIAVILEAFMDLCSLSIAARAARAIRPAESLKRLTASVIRAKSFDQFNEIHVWRYCGSH